MKAKKVLESIDARAVARACCEEAERRQIAITIAIVDDGGHLLFLERLDARPSTIDVAIRKARTAALMRAPTSRLAAKVSTNPALLALDAMPMVGGIPLMFDGQCVGAIGISGGTAEDDEAICHAGGHAIGGAIEPRVAGASPPG